MMKRDELLLDMEQRLAGRKVSAEEAATLIADDFLEFGSSGRVWTKPDIVPRDRELGVERAGT